jgi:hypothetical protein
MVSHKASLKTVYAKLDRDDPFNEIELVSFDGRERALIRGIQLRDKENKQQAIQTYTNYQREGKRKLKVLSSQIAKKIKERYPKHDGKMEHDVSDFNQSKNKSKVIKANKKQVSKFLLNKNNMFKNEKVYNRVNRSARKYPNGSLGEHRHGVNSKWSQNYRVKHGLNRNYK